MNTRFFTVIMAASLTTTLAACNILGTETSVCSSDDGQNATIEVLKASLSDATAKKSKADDGTIAVTKDTIQAVINTLKWSIEGARTESGDLNSKKIDCEGTIKISFPGTMLSDISEARSIAKLPLANELADAASLKRDGNSFKFDAKYSFQKSDDGKTLHADAAVTEDKYDFLGEMIISYSLKAKLKAAQIAADAAMQNARDEKQKELVEAHNAAMTENELSQKAIAAAWNAIPTDTKVEIMPLQKAWIDSKKADCSVDASGSSLDPMEKDTARLNCEASRNRDRVNWLRQYMPSSTF